MQRAAVTSLLVVLIALGSPASALALSRNGQRLSLQSLAITTTNSSLRYLHTTWFKQNYSFSTTETLPAADGTTTTVEVLLPRKGLNTTSSPTVHAQLSAMYATAIALHGGFFQASRVGVSTTVARRRTVAWVNGAAYSYARNAWGRDWQSALMVYYLAYGSQQVWGSLPMQTRELVASAVATEADRLLATPPLYYQDASGTIIRPGDSKSEENAWNATLLLYAARAFPGNPHASDWEKQGRWYQITAYATPNQVGTDPRINGSNLNADGTVTNHNRIHPDYMLTQAEFIAKVKLFSAQTHTAVPTETANNFGLVWRALTVTKYPRPQFRSPGGTIYRRGKNHSQTADMYFPQGTDISLYRRFNAAETDVEAFDARIDKCAYGWGKAHLLYVRKQQSRYKDGHIFSKGATRFSNDEQFAAASMAEIVARLKIIR